MISYVFSCFTENGGFSPAPNHFPTIIYTLSAIQVLVILEAVDQLGNKKQKIIEFVKSLQNSDGSFIGSPDDDKEETDTRFSFCAIATLKLLDSLDEIDTSKTVDYIKACQNFDGAFGVRVGSESHAGQVFCCVGTLALLEKLEIIDQELLGWWLADRQLPCGGLNGRPMKKEDVCYSWWALSSLVMIKKSAWIDHKKLAEFILSAADDEIGGIADRPGDIPDPFHTLFGIAGLSLLQYNNMLDLDIVSKTPDITLKPIDPVLCLPSYLLHEK